MVYLSTWTSKEIPCAKMEWCDLTITKPAEAMATSSASTLINAF